MAELKPFRAVRYDERQAGPLEALVAPPFDVISAEAREGSLARSPYNVVHLTLPDDVAEAARLWRAWQAEGVLARESNPALWWLAQDYVGPDGVPRSREGLVASLRVQPYDAGVVLPHERTHAGPKENRLRLLRAVRAHVEPIFLLYDGALSGPGADHALAVELQGVRNRLWRLPGGPPAALADARLLIADGHHRYETALAFHAEDSSEESAWMMVVVVPTEQEGLTIFPTHRLARSVDSLTGQEAGSVEEAFAALPPDRAAAVLYRAAFLLRPPTIEQVRAVAERGETMPQKSTFFYPKLPSGVLFHPL